mgnify:CR=1 FL=1
MKSGRRLATVLCGSMFLLLSMANAVLAQDITPMSGLWIIDQENNGNPGRGFQLDAQNNTLVLTFYGYEGSGDAMWWLAAGSLTVGSNQITMDLGAYEGGMAFGDPLKDATYLGPDGKVTIRFDSISSGQICLPDEPCKSISPFNFGWPNNAAELLGSWVVSGTDLANDVPFGGELSFNEVLPSTGAAVVNRARGALTLGDDGVLVQGPLTCAKLVTPDPWGYVCSAALPGQTLELGFDMRRNAIEGVFYGALGNATDVFVAFRTETQSGRATIPN